MDEEIRQLLHSLDAIEDAEPQKASEKPQIVRIPPSIPVQEPCRRSIWGLGVATVVGLICCLAIVGVYLIRELAHSSKRTIEASMHDGLKRSPLKSVDSISVFSVNDLSCNRDNRSSIRSTAQYDLLGCTRKREETLSEISKSIHNLLETIIASPDIASHNVLHGLIARFEQTDLFEMNEIVSSIEERRGCLTTREERQEFDGAMACIGLGNIGVYKKRSEEIAVASKVVDNCIATLRSSKEIVAVARIVRAAIRLFDEMSTDAIVVGSIDVQRLKQEMFEAARTSAEKVVMSLVETKRLGDISREERESVAYLYAILPSMDPKVASVLYEPLPSKSIQQIFCTENNLGDSLQFSSSRTVYLASERAMLGGP